MTPMLSSKYDSWGTRRSQRPNRWQSTGSSIAARQCREVAGAGTSAISANHPFNAIG